MPHSSPSARPRLALAGTLLVVAAVAVHVRLHVSQRDQLLNTDEADYARAAAFGLVANYLGTHERSGIAFGREVLEEFRSTGWARPFNRDWNAGDAAGLRHYHPPLALYPAAILAGPDFRDEARLRLGSLVAGALACVASGLLAFALLVPLPLSLRLTGSTIAGLLTAVSPYHAAASTEIGAHPAFGLFATLALTGLTYAVHAPTRFPWLLACCAMGLTILTVPYWALLVPSVLLVWWIGRATGGSLQSAIAGAATTALTILLAWPPFFLEAAFVKPVAMYAGVIVRPLAEPPAEGWIPAFLRAHTALVATGAIGLFGSLVVDRSWRRAFIPAVLFVAAFVVLNFRVGHMKALYASDLVPPLAALAAAGAAVTVTRVMRRGAPFATLAAAIALAVVAVWPRAAPAPDTTWKESIRVLGNHLAGQRLLVTPRAAGAILTYYLDGIDIVLDSNHPDDIEAIQAALERQEIDAVLRWGAGIERGGAAQSLTRGEANGMVLVNRDEVSWWVIK